VVPSHIIFDYGLFMEELKKRLGFCDDFDEVLWVEKFVSTSVENMDIMLWRLRIKNLILILDL